MWGIRRPKKKSKIAPSVPCQKLVGFKSLRLAKVGPLCERKWMDLRCLLAIGFRLREVAIEHGRGGIQEARACSNRFIGSMSYRFLYFMYMTIIV